jgi:phage regulator Rha-like protein
MVVIMDPLGIMDTILLSPGSIATYAGLQHTLTLISVSAHRNDDTKSELQKHSLIFLDQSYELTNSGEDKVACNNFVI